MQVYLFDDGNGRLAPLTDLRPAFAVRTGAATTIERVEQLLGDDDELAGLFVPEHLKLLVEEAYELPVNEMPTGIDSVLLINGRCPLPPGDLSKIKPGTILVEHHGEKDTEPAVVLACVKPDAAAAIIRGEVPTSGITATKEHHLLRRPWDIRRFRDACIKSDLSRLTQIPGSGLPAGTLQRGSHPVVIRSGADVWPGVTFDTTQGPVVIAAGATVRPGAIIAGPTYIGEDSSILDHALIKAHTAIGPRCKIAGEVGGTIFQGLANKAHEGHLGDSWVGEWVNFGAGTNNSNLLNTYAEVIAKATSNGSHERTGQTFLGSIVGDHVKFAISTRIMTGAVIHTGAMWAATSPVVGCVDAFTWATDTGVSAFRLPRFMDTAKVVMARRGVEPSEAYLERIKFLHDNASGANGS